MISMFRGSETRADTGTVSVFPATDTFFARTHSSTGHSHSFSVRFFRALIPRKKRGRKTDRKPVQSYRIWCLRKTRRTCRIYRLSPASVRSFSLQPHIRTLSEKSKSTGTIFFTDCLESRNLTKINKTAGWRHGQYFLR